MRRLLSPVPIADLGVLLALVALLAYGLSELLDRKGRIAAVRRGPVDETFMRERVLPLLREQA